MHMQFGFMKSGPQHANPIGTLYGGVMCDLAYAAMGMDFASFCVAKMRNSGKRTPLIPRSSRTRASSGKSLRGRGVINWMAVA
jgi:hypothetical protein